MTLDNLLRIGQLRRHTTDPASLATCIQEAEQLVAEIDGWLTANRPELTR